jgi:hypothetical protein
LPLELGKRAAERHADDLGSLPPRAQRHVVRELHDQLGPAQDGDGERRLHEMAIEPAPLFVDRARPARGGEARRDSHEQIARGERLYDVVVRASLQPLGRGLLAGARGQQDAGRRREGGVAADSVKEREPVEPRHHHVAHHEIRRIAADRGERLEPIAHDFDVPVLAKDARDVVAHVGVVVGDDDAGVRFVRGRRVLRRPRRRLARRTPPQRLFDVLARVDRRRRCARALGAHAFGRKVRRSERDADAERRPLPLAAVHVDLPAVHPHELVHEREPNAGALVASRARPLDAIETLEEARQLVGGDADAGVGDLEHRRAIIGE